MDLITSSGSKIFIASETTEQANVAGYEALTWQEIGEVEDLGEFGDAAEIIPFTSLGDGRVRKSKGAFDAGDINLVCGYDPTDDGQIDLVAALAASGGYNFKITRDDQITPVTGNPTTHYFRAIVASGRKQYGQQNNVQRISFQLAITSAVLEDAAT